MLFSIEAFFPKYIQTHTEQQKRVSERCTKKIVGLIIFKEFFNIVNTIIKSQWKLESSAALLCNIWNWVGWLFWVEKNKKGRKWTERERVVVADEGNKIIIILFFH